jgi:hypothetical protein
MHGNYKYIDKRSYSVEEAQSHIVVYLDRKGVKIPIFRESKNDRQIQWLQKGQKIISKTFHSKLMIEQHELIREDIKTLSSRDNYYPSADEIQSQTSNANYVTHSLRIFLDSLFSETDSSRKISAIGHAVIQATRPKGVIAHLQIGLAIQLHHHFGSQFLIDTLYNLGFSSSCSEV